MSQVNVYHQEEGVVFRKISGEEGISYITVDLTDIGEDKNDLLVRHGDPEKGYCGYYPVKLLYADRGVRQRAAVKARKRAPSEYWVRRQRLALEEAGFKYN